MSDIKAREEIVDHALIRVPARFGRDQRWEEGVGTAEVVGLDEAEALKDVLAVGCSVQSRPRGALLHHPPKGIEIQRTRRRRRIALLK